MRRAPTDPGPAKRWLASFQEGAYDESGIVEASHLPRSMMAWIMAGTATLYPVEITGGQNFGEGQGDKHTGIQCSSDYSQFVVVREKTSAELVRIRSRQLIDSEFDRFTHLFYRHVCGGLQPGNLPETAQLQKEHGARCNV